MATYISTLPQSSDCGVLVELTNVLIRMRAAWKVAVAEKTYRQPSGEAETLGESHWVLLPW